tara:strand:+ start:1302 stop:1451 length:150 start_codon:yes stop_codon:yes gene_type:complete
MNKSKERLLICASCENLTKFKVCKACMCFMPLKARLVRAKCPKNKWRNL